MAASTQPLLIIVNVGDVIFVVSSRRRRAAKQTTTLQFLSSPSVSSAAAAAAQLAAETRRRAKLSAARAKHGEFPRDRKWALPLSFSGSLLAAFVEEEKRPVSSALELFPRTVASENKQHH